jgi:hypothetical protein
MPWQVKQLRLPVGAEDVLAWMGAQEKAVSLADISAGLGLQRGEAAQLDGAVRGLQAACEVYETGLHTGLFRVF